MSGCTDRPEPYSDFDELSARAAEHGAVGVNARGRVERVFSPELFRVGEGGWFSDGLWVVCDRRQTPLAVDDYVVVSGMLRAGPVHRLEREHGLDLPQEIAEQLADEGLLLSESVTIYADGSPPG